ncbi:MAG: glycosyltransferase [Synergistetes bacterium]|nr:glycosyltransferase [Synergistota bacterium]
MVVYTSALRPPTRKRLEEIESADILVGIPCYNNEKTIAGVVETVSEGLYKYYRNLRSVIFVADGGSTDDSREMAESANLKPWQEKIVSIYRGPSGKGSAFRLIFEAASLLDVKVCVTVDADLRSITSDWLKNLIDPILEKGYQFVAPIYIRHKHDGTITNNIVYNVTRALYGKRVRQPIGGDFAYSRDLVSFYIKQPVWDTDVARFGVDIWVTTEAIVNDFRICQANLGVKVHDVKDPAMHLGPMFRQVVWTMFYLMKENEIFWKSVSGSMPVEIYGEAKAVEPEPVKVNLDNLLYEFKMGFKQFAPLWQNILSEESFSYISRAYELSTKEFRIPTEIWANIIYEWAATYNVWPVNTRKLVTFMMPLYFGRVASFILETMDMTSEEAERYVEEQAVVFEERKPYLIKVWDEKKKEAEEGMVGF